MLHCSTCDSVSKFLTTLALSNLTGKGKVNECIQSFLVNNLQQNYCVDFYFHKPISIIIVVLLNIFEDFFLTFRGPRIVIYSYNKSQKVAQFLNFIVVKNSTCFRQPYCASSGVLMFKYAFSIIYFAFFEYNITSYRCHAFYFLT
jgi:hypothetical protein